MGLLAFVVLLLQTIIIQEFLQLGQRIGCLDSHYFVVLIILLQVKRNTPFLESQQFLVNLIAVLISTIQNSLIKQFKLCANKMYTLSVQCLSLRLALPLSLSVLRVMFSVCAFVYSNWSVPLVLWQKRCDVDSFFLFTLGSVWNNLYIFCSVYTLSLLFCKPILCLNLLYMLCLTYVGCLFLLSLLPLKFGSW